MGISYPATPQIYNLAPKISPNISNSEHTHLPATSGLVVFYLLAPPTLCSTPLPYYTPPPSHPAPSAYSMPYPLTQNMLFVILMSPSSLAGPLFSLFFGWWAKPGVDTSALWDHYPVSCIRVASRGEIWQHSKPTTQHPQSRAISYQYCPNCLHPLIQYLQFLPQIWWPCCSWVLPLWATSSSRNASKLALHHCFLCDKHNQWSPLPLQYQSPFFAFAWLLCQEMWARFTNNGSTSTLIPTAPSHQGPNYGKRSRALVSHLHHCC